jgi:hypothetical protein
MGSHRFLYKERLLALSPDILFPDGGGMKQDDGAIGKAAPFPGKEKDP